MRFAAVVPHAVRQKLFPMVRRLTATFGVDRYSRPSLHGIEDKLDDLFAGRPGYFVEAGAFDGFTQSNTYWLERFRGWHGILVEPIPQQARACRRLRKRSTTIQCALVPPGERGSVTVRFAGLMSIATGARGSQAADDQHVAAGLKVQGDLSTYELVVPGRTLTDVLESAGAPSIIDLLSLDVEGLERQVLEGLDTGRFMPRFILVEVNDTGATSDLLRTMGYELIDEEFTPRDALYQRTTIGSRAT